MKTRHWDSIRVSFQNANVNDDAKDVQKIAGKGMIDVCREER
jgi:hypothetical protein